MTTFQKRIILLLIFLIAGWFYWFQYRPAQVKTECNAIAADNANKILKTRASMTDSHYDRDRYQKAYKQGLHFPEDYDVYYEKCLRNKGL